LGQLAPEESSYVHRRQECFRKYRALYEHYQAVDRSVRFAPFHLIATEGRTYFDQNHLWHMQTLGALARHGGDIFLRTPHRFVSLRDQRAVEECTRWWDQLSESGEEGVVVKPLYFVPRGRRGFAQPAIKCRGAEHLRLVYGPEYDLPENRLRLFDRPALKRRREKHRRVLRQFALSVEGVERFIRGDGLDRVAECVRGVLALESRDY
jgi:protein phosphatase